MTETLVFSRHSEEHIDLIDKFIRLKRRFHPSNAKPSSKDINFDKKGSRHHLHKNVQ